MVAPLERHPYNKSFSPRHSSNTYTIHPHDRSRGIHATMLLANLDTAIRVHVYIYAFSSHFTLTLCTPSTLSGNEGLSGEMTEDVHAIPTKTTNPWSYRKFSHLHVDHGIRRNLMYRGLLRR